MSWSVSAKGSIGDVTTALESQFLYPLAIAPAGIADEGERETVRLAAQLIRQCLGTFDSDKLVTVRANGHISFDTWERKNGAVQTVNLTIFPGIVG